jgi:hypothetical protein
VFNTLILVGAHSHAILQEVHSVIHIRLCNTIDNVLL